MICGGHRPSASTHGASIMNRQNTMSFSQVLSVTFIDKYLYLVKWEFMIVSVSNQQLFGTRIMQNYIEVMLLYL